MTTLIAGIALVVLGLFMSLGFVRSGLEISAASIAAILIGGVLPLGAGAAMIRNHLRRGQGLQDSKAALRQQTLLAEVLQLARRKGGRLTVIEVAAEFAVTPDQAKDVLNDLMRQELADIEVTDEGLLVYRFGDVERLADKNKSRDLLNG